MLPEKVLELNKMLIYTSSVATLGITPNKISNEQSETSLCKIDGHYKKSKFLAEKIVTNLIKKKKLKAIILNPSTLLVLEILNQHQLEK